MKLMFRVVFLSLFCVVAAVAGSLLILNGSEYWATKPPRKSAVQKRPPRTPEQLEAERRARRSFQREPLPEHPVISSETLHIGGPEHSLAAQFINEAFLMIAREDFHLPTRDDYLRESFHLETAVRFEPMLTILDKGPMRSEKSYQVSLGKSSGKRQSAHLDAIPIRDESMLDIAYRELEQLTEKEYPRLLCELGFSKTELPAGKSVDVSDILLSTPPLNFMKVFDRLRRLHKALHEAPRSPELLATISEHYTLLGSLTELSWGREGKAFKTRAILYADRGLRFHQKDPRLLWSRALAEGLTGMEYRALPTLRQAQAASSSNAKIPAWGSALDAFLRWDEVELARLATADAPLARYLRMLAVEMCGTGNQFVAAVTDVMKDHPECYRGSAMLAHTGSLGLRRAIEEAQLDQFLNSFPENLREFSNLPSSLDELARQIEEAPSEEEKIVATAALVGALKDEGTHHDTNEPSLGALATLVEDLHLSFAMQILNTRKFQLAVDADDQVAVFQKLLAYHPAKAIVGAYLKDQDKASQAINEAMIPILRLSPSYFAWSLTKWTANAGGPFSNFVGMKAQGGADAVTPDLLQWINASRQTDVREPLLKQLQRVSPHCPMVKSYLVSTHWEEAEPHLDEWLKETSNPNLINSLAAHYATSSFLHEEDFEAAEAYYKQFIELDPSYDAYLGLANHYRNHEDHQRYRETLLQALGLPDLGLESSRVHEQVARSLMKEGRYVEARSHAMAAADSYSGWGLLCGAECLEGLGEWEAAEKLVRNNALRYDDWVCWYAWCRRTGHGDLDAARDLAASRIASMSPEARNKHWAAAAFFLLEGRSDEAIEIFRKMQDASPDNDFCDANLALALLESGREGEAKQAIPLKFSFSPTVMVMESWLRSTKDNPAWTPEDLEFAAELWPLENGPAQIQCVIGRLLLALGRKEEAVPWLQRAEASPTGHVVDRMMAGALLRKIDVSPLPLSPRLFDERHPHARSRFARYQLVGAKVEEDVCRKFLQKMLKDAPDWKGGKFWVAYWAFQKKDFQTAANEFNELVESLPNQVYLRTFRGKVYEHLGRFREARDDYRAVLKVSPRLNIAINNLAWIYAAAPADELRDGPQAVELFQQFSPGKGNQAEIYLLLKAAASAECGHYEDAVEILEDAQRKKLLPGFSPDPFLECYRARKPYHKLPRNSAPGALASSG